MPLINTSRRMMSRCASDFSFVQDRVGDARLLFKKKDYIKTAAIPNRSKATKSSRLFLTSGAAQSKS
jgi:hypothetical protein